MHDKRNKIIISVLSILFVIASVAAIVLFIKNKESNETLVITEQEYQNKISTLASENKSNENTKVENTTTEKVVEVQVSKIITFDSSKVINTKQNSSYLSTSENEKLSLMLENNKPYMLFKEDLTGKYLGDIELNNITKFPTWEKIEITGFSKKVLNIKCAIIGQNDLDYMLLFLMEDGTVEYVNLYNAIKNSSLKTQGKISGLESIVKLDNCIVSNTNNEASSLSVVAINNKGEAYDISLLLK